MTHDKKLTVGQTKFFAALLTHISESLANKICNDIPKDIKSILSEEDKLDLIERYKKFNKETNFGDDDAEDEGDGFLRYDWICVDLLSWLMTYREYPIKEFIELNLDLVHVKDLRGGTARYFAVNNKHYDGMLASGGSNLDLTHQWKWLGEVSISEEILNEQGYFYLEK